MLRIVSQIVVISVTLLASENLFAKDDNKIPALTFGVVFPSSALATVQNPAISSIDDGDHIEVLGALPYSADHDTLEIKRATIKRYPSLVTYAGSPKPFGMGMAVQWSESPDVYGGAGFGIEQLQVGYCLHMQPMAKLRNSDYFLRLGGASGVAAAIKWGDDKPAVGAGLALDFGKMKVIAEIDADFDFEFAGDPILSGTVGITSSVVNFNIGYKPRNLKDFSVRSELVHFGLQAWLTRRLGFEVYYQTLLAQFSAGLNMRF